MKSSVELHELATALSAAQGEFPIIPKNRDAEIVTKSGGSYGYKYADLSDTIEALRPILAKNGLSVVQGIGRRKGVDVIETRILHSSGQWIESRMRVPGVTTTEAQSATPQAFGSGITYGKRYAYSAMLNVSTDTDDDGKLAELAWGDDATRTRGRRAPKSSTPTGRTRVESQDPETVGKTGMAATARNKLISHLAHLDPPVRTPEEQIAKVNALLPSPDISALTKLTAEQGAQLFRILGIKS